MIVFPQISPIALSIGPIDIHWYGIMYLIGFLAAWGLAVYRSKHYHEPWSNEQISDLLFYAALGVIIGGRLGYMFFYDTNRMLANPLDIFKIWQGGMSFHGGLIGVACALVLFANKTKKHFLHVTDFVAPLVPIGLGAGRIGNFINGELWGRPTDVPWAVIFPQADYLPRHPSQLYECLLEGFILFILVWWYASKPRPKGCVSAIFLIGYSICRIIVEYFRQPDPQVGYVAFNTVTMGQLLSLPMLLIGLGLWWKQRNANLS